MLGFRIGSLCIWSDNMSDDSRLSGFKSLIMSIFLLMKGGLQGRDGRETELIAKDFNKQFIK